MPVQYLRSDNGPEFLSTKLATSTAKHNLLLDFIQPGKPAQNAYIERFNRTYREEVLDLYAFPTLDEVRTLYRPILPLSVANPHG